MMNIEITAPKMQKFQDSLAKLLRVALVVLNRDGKVLAKYNLPVFLLHLYNHPDLEDSYRRFFKNIPDLDWQKDVIQVIEDPLGLSAVAFCLDSGLFIALVGYLDGEPQSRERFLTLLRGYGFNGGKDILPEIPAMEAAKQKDQAIHIRTLYHLLVEEREKEGKSGGQSHALLMVLKQINQIMFSLLNLEMFELHRLLSLIASLLIIHLNAEGAWIFTYLLPQGAVSVQRGAVWEEMILEVKKEWEGAVKEGSDPRKLFSHWQESPHRPRGYKLETIFLDREKMKVFLGVVNSDTGKPTEALAACSRQVATALEIATIYGALQQRLRYMLNSIRHGIVVTDNKGKFVFINQAAAFILAFQESSCSLGEQIRHHPLAPEIIQAIEDAASSGQTYFEQQSCFQNGKNSLHINWDVVPLLDNDATTLGAILLLKDVTKEVNLRRQLQESERLAIAGEVAASLAHEIRNPLTVALGSLQFWAMVDDPLKQRELLEMTRNELKRMNHILTNFLNLSKPRQVEVVEEFNPEKEIEELVTLIKSEALLNDIDLEVLPSSGKLPAVRGSKNDLKQVCLNVAKNAIEAMQQGGKLAISLKTQNGQAWITFQDNGPGISEENLQNIFRPFFTTKLTGTGLGLYICYNIIKDMGGELRFESQLGQGTSVHIILPPAQVQEREVR